MKTRQTRANTMRVTSLLASAAITARLVGSQLCITDSYTQQADAVLAAKNAQQPLSQSPAASAPSRI